MNDKLFNKRIDYYYLSYEINDKIIDDITNNIIKNRYRSFATFNENIKYFKNIPCSIISLLNYPVIDSSQHTISRLFESIDNTYIDEIEFPWLLYYNTLPKSFWRNIIIQMSKKGILLRPMLELSVWNTNDINATIEYLKSINIMSVMMSTGLNPNIVTLNNWETIREYIPYKWNVKICGVKNSKDLMLWLANDVDIIGTTKIFQDNSIKENLRIINKESVINNDYDISHQELDELNDIFNINGAFNCSYNNIENLLNSPIAVNGSYDCSYNAITSLIGICKILPYDFYCNDNQLENLDYMPIVGGSILLQNNNLVTLRGMNDKINRLKGNLDLSSNRLTNLEFIYEIIEGDLDISFNPINTIQYFPLIKGDLYCEKTNLSESDIRLLKSRNIVKGDIIK